MKISAKIIVKELAKSILGSTSLKVCTDKKSEMYGQLVKDTFIRDFLAKSNPIPSERLCNRINDLFDYELYPHNYKDGKHTASPKEMAEIIRRYIVGLLSCDLTATILNEPIDIKTASRLIGDLLNVIEGEQEIPVEEMAHIMKMKYAKTSSYVSFINLQNHPNTFKDSYYSLIDKTNLVRDSIRQTCNFFTNEETIDSHAKIESEHALSDIKDIMNLFLSLIKAETFEDMSIEIQEKFKQISSIDYTIYNRITDNYTICLTELLSTGYKRSEALEYINCVLEIISKKSGMESLSPESEKLVKKSIAKNGKIIDLKPYDKYLWKINYSCQISKFYRRNNIESKYLYYYIKENIDSFQRPPHRYDVGIKQMENIYSSLKEEITHLYKPIDSAVINIVNNIFSGEYIINKPKAGFLDKIKQYSPNELLIGYDSGLIWFETLICNIINTLKALQKIEKGLESGRIFF